MDLSVNISDCMKNYDEFIDKVKKEGFYSNGKFLIPSINANYETKKKILTFSMSQVEGFQNRDISWIFIDTKLLIKNHLLSNNGHYFDLTAIRRVGIPKYDLELLFVRGENPNRLIEHTYYLFSDPDFKTEDLNHLLGTLKYIEILWPNSIDLEKLGKWREIYLKMESIFFTDFEIENFFSLYLKQMLNYKQNHKYFELIIKGDIEKINLKDFKLS